MAAPLSAIRAPCRRGTVPSGRMNPPRWASAISVPVLSNRSTNRKANTTVTRPIWSAPARSICRNTGAIDGGMSTIPANFCWPAAMAMMVTTRMPMITPPITRRYSSAMIRKKPSAAITTGKLVSLPCVTRVAGSSTTTPAFLSAIRARNRPMPAAIAILSDLGMAFTIHSRIGSTLMMKKMTPEMNTQPSATCQLQLHAADHAEGEVGVQPHAGRQRDRVVGQEGHQEAADGRRHAGRREHRAERHARRLQDVRVDEDDVGHRQEGRDPGHDLGPDVGLVLAELEDLLEHCCSPPVVA